MSYSVFYDIGIAVAAATILAIAFNFFRQPPILGYIVAGLLIGPVLGIVKDTAAQPSATFPKSGLRCCFSSSG